MISTCETTSLLVGSF